MTTEVQQPPPFLAAAVIRLGHGKARASGSNSDNRAPATTCSDDTSVPPFTIELKCSLSVSRLLFSATVAQRFFLHRLHLTLIFLPFFPLLPMFFPHSSLSTCSIILSLHVYTHAKFRKVQEQFRGKVNCITRSTELALGFTSYEVLEQVSNSKFNKFVVTYDAMSCEVKFQCLLSESRGILCHHCLSALSFEKVDKLAPRYILEHWSKNVKRRHTHIKSSHDEPLLEPRSRRFDDLINDLQNPIRVRTRGRLKNRLGSNIKNKCIKEKEKKAISERDMIYELDQRHQQFIATSGLRNKLGQIAAKENLQTDGMLAFSCLEKAVSDGLGSIIVALVLGGLIPRLWRIGGGCMCLLFLGLLLRWCRMNCLNWHSNEGNQKVHY
ncbi:hypothetical protein Ahy_B02g058965 [Arachis hypogaea]|uniref:Protein FAR1-RELATED SEQUENCE n=1 Tax=Arachis hypogaea TaxID=3818 RepID=A0A445AFT0_ARAHY|nr:hypothetical protein Ahy_B02g058965 [Arachis hypogaea]